VCLLMVAWRCSLQRFGSAGLNITLSIHGEVKEAIGLGKGDANLPGRAGSGLMKGCCVSPRQLKLGAIPL